MEQGDGAGRQHYLELSLWNRARGHRGGAVNNVYVAHRFAGNLDGGGVEVAAKVERAWEFIQMAGYSAVGVVVFALLAVVLSRALRDR